MPKLYTSKEIDKVLLRKGFQQISQLGSHRKYSKTTGQERLTVILPANKKAIPTGTFRSILRQANLTKQEFENLLK